MVTKIEVCYYAVESNSGDIWECDDCRTLYESVRREFRADMHMTKYYDFRGAALYYGILIHEDGNRSWHVSYKEIGYLYVSGCDGRIVSCEFERM